VEDLLRLSRLESPQQMSSAMEIDLGDVINTAVDGLRPLAEERGIAVQVEVGGRRALVPGDRGLLTQAISNLIENAINYNREKGRVYLKLKGSAGTGSDGTGYQWDLTVSDTGIGIPKDALSRIFERFYRVDKARSRERGGTGLGLAIVKHIALAHGATIHVDSEIDKGTTFTLKFRSRENAAVIRKGAEEPVA
jgi:two-component system phosphate regulon sensor histidine kinase PhoR